MVRRAEGYQIRKLVVVSVSVVVVDLDYVLLAAHAAPPAAHSETVVPVVSSRPEVRVRARVRAGRLGQAAPCVRNPELLFADGTYLSDEILQTVVPPEGLLVESEALDCPLDELLRRAVPREVEPPLEVSLRNGGVERLDELVVCYLLESVAHGHIYLF